MNLLTPLGKLYGRVMDVRNRMYDRGTLRSHSLGAWTVSIGNVTAGGTGKTPLVALTAHILAENGEKVCILTRGYGRANENERVLVSDTETVLADAATAGDEPVELARKLLGKAIVLADADRVSAAIWARKQFGITAFVLDDAFQHRRAKRDVDVVCVDATNPCGNGNVLPAGTLRESFAGLLRADAIVLTRTNLVESTEKIVELLKKWNSLAPIFSGATRIVGISELSAFASGKQTYKKDDEIPKNTTHPFAFCGLGNPENFRRQLELADFRISAFRSFGDHHRYGQRDVDALEREALSSSAACLITTVKDAVKLEGLRFSMPVYVVETEIVLDDLAGFRRMILPRE